MYSESWRLRGKKLFLTCVPGDRVFPEETNQLLYHIIFIPYISQLQVASLAELALAGVLDLDVGADVLYIPCVVLNQRPQHLHHHL